MIDFKAVKVGDKIRMGPVSPGHAKEGELLEVVAVDERGITVKREDGMTGTIMNPALSEES